MSNDAIHASGGCRELLQDLNDYIDGELDAQLCLEIERHMAGCDNCRIVVDTLRKTVLLYRSLPAETMPADASLRLYKCLKLEPFIAAS